MNVSMELLVGIGLSLCVPLLGLIASTLWGIKSNLSLFETKIIDLVSSMERTLTQRIELLEERLRHHEE